MGSVGGHDLIESLYRAVDFHAPVDGYPRDSAAVPHTLIREHPQLGESVNDEIGGAYSPKG
jgi:hypothetical protein